MAKEIQMFSSWYLLGVTVVKHFLRNISQGKKVVGVTMENIETWHFVSWQSYRSQPLYKHLVENHSDLAMRKSEKGREGGGAEFSSQSLELWLWENTVTLSSQNPLGRGGILSLGPLGLEKAIEGYFLRSQVRGSEGKKKNRGESSGWEGFFWVPAWEMNRRKGNNLKRQKHKETTKHKPSR